MAVKSAWLTKQDAGDANMIDVSGYIATGAMALLKAELKVLTYFSMIAAILLAWSGTLVENSSPIIAVSFLIGAFFSALAGYIGMNIATKANVRTTQAAGQVYLRRCKFPLPVALSWDLVLQDWQY